MNYPLVTIVRHPLAQYYLTQLRLKTTPTPAFRKNLNDLTRILFWQASQSLPSQPQEVETPLGAAEGTYICETNIILAPVLRAGLGMLAPLQELLPGAPVGFIGLFRDETTLQAQQYYAKFPTLSNQHEIFVLDPMLATGNSACEALRLLQAHGAQKLHFLCVLAAPEGIEQLRKHFPEVPVTTAAIDEKLTSNGFIFPGLGDAGDRLMGT